MHKGLLSLPFALLFTLPPAATAAAQHKDIIQAQSSVTMAQTVARLKQAIVARHLKIWPWSITAAPPVRQAWPCDRQRW